MFSSRHACLGPTPANSRHLVLRGKYNVVALWQGMFCSGHACLVSTHTNIRHLVLKGKCHVMLCGRAGSALVTPVWAHTYKHSPPSVERKMPCGDSVAGQVLLSSRLSGAHFANIRHLVVKGNCSVVAL